MLWGVGGPSRPATVTVMNTTNLPSALGAAVLLSISMTVVLAPPAAAGSNYTIPSSGETVSTFTTTPGVTYALRFSGTYTYNAQGSMADCSHVQSADDPTVWFWPSGNVLVDEVSASCGAYRDDHTYTIYRSGTGAPFQIRIWDSIYDDNVGSLNVHVAPVVEIE
jgi:hypothetical protein